jgi:hypothetical protein
MIVFDAYAEGFDLNKLYKTRNGLKVRFYAVIVDKLDATCHCENLWEAIHGAILMRTIGGWEWRISCWNRYGRSGHQGNYAEHLDIVGEWDGD